MQRGFKGTLLVHPGSCCHPELRRTRKPVWGALFASPSVCPRCWDWTQFPTCGICKQRFQTRSQQPFWPRPQKQHPGTNAALSAWVLPRQELLSANTISSQLRWSWGIIQQPLFQHYNVTLFIYKATLGDVKRRIIKGQLKSLENVPLWCQAKNRLATQGLKASGSAGAGTDLEQIKWLTGKAKQQLRKILSTSAEQFSKPDYHKCLHMAPL